MATKEKKQQKQWKDMTGGEKRRVVAGVMLTLAGIVGGVSIEHTLHNGSDANSNSTSDPCVIYWNAHKEDGSLQYMTEDQYVNQCHQDNQTVAQLNQIATDHGQ